MLHFYFGEPATCFLTLQEEVTLPSPSYLFVFKCRVPDKVVSAVLIPDASTERADTFTIDVDTLFAGCDTGLYTYAVYEQDNSDNLDPAAAGAMLECGLAELHPANPFTFTERAVTSHFIQPE